jgi:hypothetical protein
MPWCARISQGSYAQPALRRFYRGHIMRKMAEDLFTALVNIATKLKLEPTAV